MGHIFKGVLTFGILVMATLSIVEGHTGTAVALVIGILYFLYADGRNKP